MAERFEIVEKALLKLLEEKKYATLRDILATMNPMDVAGLFDGLDEKQIPLMFRLLPKEQAAETFVEMEPEAKELLIRGFSDNELKEVLDELYVDDAADIVEEMPANVVQRILKHADPEMRSSINQILRYPEDSAGSIMTTEYVSLRPHMTVEEAILRIRRQGVDKETIYTCYITERRKLVGIVSAKDLMTTDDDVPIKDLMETEIISVYTHAVQEQVAAAEQDIATLEKQKKALQGNVKLLKAVEKVKPDLEAIQPEKTLTGAVKGVTVEQVKELKAAAIRGAAAEQKVQELKEENQRLQQKIPSTKEKLKEAQERQRLENQNRKLLVQVECLEQELEQERSFSDRLLDGVSAVMDFLDRHLPEKFRPLVERARELLPVPEVQQPEQEQERGHTWGGMEL